MRRPCRCATGYLNLLLVIAVCSAAVCRMLPLRVPPNVRLTGGAHVCACQPACYRPATAQAPCAAHMHRPMTSVLA